MVNDENHHCCTVVHACYFLGISEDLLTKMVGAENKITLTISQNTEGSFNLSISHSTASELNFSSTFKVAGIR